MSVRAGEAGLNVCSCLFVLVLGLTGSGRRASME